jgi:hypothetical protein
VSLVAAFGSTIAAVRPAATGSANPTPSLIRSPLGWDEPEVSGGNEGVSGAALDARVWNDALAVTSDNGIRQLSGAAASGRIGLWDGELWSTPVADPGGNPVRVATVGPRLFVLGNLPGEMGVREWDGALGAGAHQVRWGDPVRPGVYLARLDVPGQGVRTIRIARFR